MIGSKPDQRKTVEALGLRKMNQTVEHADNAAIRGMVRQSSSLSYCKGTYNIRILE